MKTILFFLLASLSIFFACGRDSKAGTEQEFQKIILSPTDSIVIEVDAEFNVDGLSSFFQAQAGSDQFFVRSNRNMYSVDFNHGITVKQPIAEEGPKSIKTISEFDGLASLEDGSLIYANHFANQILHLKESDAASIYTVGEDDRIFSFPYSPIINSEKYLLIPKFGNWLKDLNKIYSFYALDKKKLSIRPVIPYPEKYGAHYWGDTPYLYWASIQYIELLQKYYVSFPVEDFIYIYDEEFRFLEKKKFVSNYIKSIPPMMDEKPQSPEDAPDYIKDRAYYTGLSYYLRGIFDPKNQLFYRMTIIPEVDETNERSVRYTLIIGDQYLNYLGEWDIPPQYRLDLTITSSKGLLLFNTARYTMDKESLLPYDVFAYQKE